MLVIRYVLIKSILCHFTKCVYLYEVKLLSRVRLFVTPWTIAHQVPPFMKISWQEYWSGLPFPSPGVLPDPGIKPGSPALQADAFMSKPPRKPVYMYKYALSLNIHLYSRWNIVFWTICDLFPFHPKYSCKSKDSIFSCMYVCVYGEGNGTPLQYTCWKIPWTEEPGRLQSMGSLRVGHDWVTSLSLFTFMHWRRKWQSTPVFLPGESQGRGSLVGCRLRDHTESDTTEAT